VEIGDDEAQPIDYLELREAHGLLRDLVGVEVEGHGYGPVFAALRIRVEDLDKIDDGRAGIDERAADLLPAQGGKGDVVDLGIVFFAPRSCRSSRPFRPPASTPRPSSPVTDQIERFAAQQHRLAATIAPNLDGADEAGMTITQAVAAAERFAPAGRHPPTP
jgi:hypothetical protein